MAVITIAVVYGQAANVRREPSPLAARHDHDGPPEDPPLRGWGVSSALNRLFSWSSTDRPLPPLTASGLRGSDVEVHDEGRVHDPHSQQPNVLYSCCSIRSTQRIFLIHFTSRILLVSVW